MLSATAARHSSRSHRLAPPLLFPASFTLRHDQGAPSEAGQTTTATSNDGGDAAASFGGALSRSVTEMTGTSWRDVDTLSGDSDSSGDPAVDGGEEGSSLARNNTFAARHSGVSAEFTGNT